MISKVGKMTLNDWLKLVAWVSMILLAYVIAYWLWAYRHMVVAEDWSALLDVVQSMTVLLTIYTVIVVVIQMVGSLHTAK